MSAPRFNMTRRIRLGLTALAVIALWRFISSDQAMNAAMALVFGGVVPGTDIVLSPTTLLISEAVIIGVATLMATWHLSATYTRHQERRHTAAATPEPPTLAPQLVTATEEQHTDAFETKNQTETEEVEIIPTSVTTQEITPEPIVILPAKPLRAHRIRTARTYHPRPINVMSSFALPTIRKPHINIRLPKPSAPSIAWSKLIIIVRLPAFLGLCLWQGLKRFTLTSYHLVVALLRQLVMLSQMTGETATRFAQYIWREARKTAIKVWVWATPYILRYDKWVLTTTRRFCKWVAKKTRASISRHDNVHFVLTIAKDALRLVPTRQTKANRDNRDPVDTIAK